MCGIAGLVAASVCSRQDALDLATAMGATLDHRGPDSTGVWVDGSCTVALAHQRLSILDLSASGHQPMQSAGSRFVLAFNGEIYNHLALRIELEGSHLAPQWLGHSDTETLLAGFEAWGVKETLRRAVGMFALALWDRVERRLVVARDRMGEKPLYYGWIGEGGERAFVFGSELKALRALPTFTNRISPEALAKYLEYGYVPAPLSIFENIFKLAPGTLLALQEGDVAAGLTKLTAMQYWQAADTAMRGFDNQITSDEEAVAALEKALGQSVSAQAIADVPLGAFLSGGVDSSVITALLQEQSARPVKTFTVGFDQRGFDEAPFARAVARHLGTEHNELRVSPEDARSIIPLLPTLYDEPFADSSQIPTFFICKAARQHVSVALSGDGADELFGGYNRYLWANRVRGSVGWMPASLRQGIGSAVRRVPGRVWNAVGDYAKIARLDEKVHKLANRIGAAGDMESFYHSLVTEWPAHLALALGAKSSKSRLESLRIFDREPAHQMMLWDALTYLPDDVLTKVDRAAMGVSLETRAPFLDHNIVELAWRLPLRMKIRGGQSKWALRQILYKYVPRDLIERPKAGFAVPIGDWLRGPLRDWAEELLDAKRLHQEGFLNPDPIREAWEQHLTGRWDWTGRLWTVLMFQAWLQESRALPMQQSAGRPAGAAQLELGAP